MHITNLNELALFSRQMAYYCMCFFTGTMIHLISANTQTGSGKTFTMEGPEEKVLLESELDGRGMIPRAVQQVFSSALDLREKGWEVRVLYCMGSVCMSNRL